MSFKMRLLALVIMGTGLTACGGGGGGNNNLFNPAEDTSTGSTTGDTDPTTDETDTTEDSGLTTSDPDDIYTVENEFVGFYIESPQYDPTSYSVGAVYIRTFLTPDNMEEDFIFEGISSFHYEPCQDDNLFTFTGIQQPDGSIESYQENEVIDGINQTYFVDLTWDGSGYKGPYNLAASANIDNACLTHQQAVRGKIEVYPLNTTQFTDTLSDSVIAFSTEGTRTINWNYAEFSDVASDIEHISISVIDKDALDSIGFFSDEYQLRTELEALQEDPSADSDDIEAAEQALSSALSNHRLQMTEDVFLFQQTISGSLTSFTLPDDVNLVSGGKYLLNLTAWSSDGESNFVYYHSSHEFFAN